MPRFIVRLTDTKTEKDYFLLWSTIIDSPLQQFNGQEDATEYLKETLIPSEFELSSNSLASQRTSNPNYSLQDIYDTNCDGIRSMKGLVARFVQKT